MARTRRDGFPRRARARTGDGSRTEAAAFIAGAVAELLVLAHRHDLKVLAHLLDMSKVEADSLGREARATKAYNNDT